MARASAGRRGPGGAARDPDDRVRIVDAALARIAADGWRRLSLAAVAAEAGMPILRVYRSLPSKQAILCGFFRRIDEAALADPSAPEAGEHPRDRLFDLLMRRLDAARIHKPAFVRLRRELPADPATALLAGVLLLRSMRLMLDAADIATSGLRGGAAVKLTAAAYLAAVRVWEGDDSADLGAAMAALDARLRRIERWLVPMSPSPPRGAGPSAGFAAPQNIS
jgi:AcrR family transcriptional regulator